MFSDGLKFGFVWRGIGSNEVEFNTGKQLLESFTIKPQTKAEFKEGNESGEFWSSVKGKGDYSKIKDQMIVSDGFESRLFEVSNSTGYTFMKQVPAFRQEDLLTEDVYILDSFHEIFIWLGVKSNKFEKNGAYKDV